MAGEEAGAAARRRGARPGAESAARETVGRGPAFRAILRPCGPAKVSDLLSQLVSVSGGQEAPRVGAGDGCQ